MPHARAPHQPLSSSPLPAAAQKTLDAKGDCLLEMPTGTGKTVTLLSLITSYQRAHPEAGKLVYCTRTVPEMTKVGCPCCLGTSERPRGHGKGDAGCCCLTSSAPQAVEELKRVVQYRHDELVRDALKAGADAASAETTAAASDLLGLCLSSRRNMCIHPRVVDESDREKVDALCRNMTASWVRSRAEEDPTVRLCEFYENYDRMGTDADLRGIFTLDDLKKAGEEKGWCPYFLARHTLSFANVVVYNYQYMLDPKIANLVSRELEDKSIVVFGESGPGSNPGARLALHRASATGRPSVLSAPQMRRTTLTTSALRRCR